MRRVIVFAKSCWLIAAGILSTANAQIQNASGDEIVLIGPRNELDGRWVGVGAEQAGPDLTQAVVISTANICRKGIWCAASITVKKGDLLPFGDKLRVVTSVRRDVETEGLLRDFEEKKRIGVPAALPTGFAHKHVAVLGAATDFEMSLPRNGYPIAAGNGAAYFSEIGESFRVVVTLVGVGESGVGVPQANISWRSGNIDPGRNSNQSELMANALVYDGGVLKLPVIGEVVVNVMSNIGVNLSRGWVLLVPKTTNGE